MKLEYFLTPYTKINSKWITDLNVRPETIKLRGKQAEHSMTYQSKILYDKNPRVMEIKSKVNRWDLIKLKSFCTANKAISKVKRKPSEWEKILANETTDKGLISKNIQVVHTAQYQKNKQPTQKVGKDLNRHFPKEDIQMANKHMKRCSISLIIRECKSKLQ